MRSAQPAAAAASGAKLHCQKPAWSSSPAPRGCGGRQHSAREVGISSDDALPLNRRRGKDSCPEQSKPPSAGDFAENGGKRHYKA